MRRRKTILCWIVCAGIVCILFAFSQRRRLYTIFSSNRKPSSPQVYEVIKRNGTNQGVANITRMCEVPQRLATYVDTLRQRRISKGNVPSVGVSDQKVIVNEFSIHRKLDSYPINGTGTPVDNLSDYFDPAIFNSFCKTPANLTAIVPVYSTADRFTHRHLLRNSLGRLATSLNCKMFFIIGVSTDAQVNDLLQEEYAVERDILIVGKVDTYRDLNNKAYAMIHWINKFCKHVPYVVHLIDDTYVNLRSMLERLPTIKEKYYIYARKAITRTIRTSEPKSFVTVDEYIYNRFPPYAYGMVYAFPTVVAEKLLNFAHSATYCWIEDVWIGGHVRIAANVKIVQFSKADWIERNYKNKKHIKKQKSPPVCLATHPVGVEELCEWYNQDSS